jgi:hypothetical protein
MQYLQVISGLLCDDLLFTIDGFSSPLVELADGYEIGEFVVTLFPSAMIVMFWAMKSVSPSLLSC